MASSLNGKVAIVTGSSAGLGEAIALLLASRGAGITFCGRDKDRLQAVLDKVVEGSGGNKDRFIAVAGDLTESKVREEIIEQTIKKFGRLDILVANAGILSTFNSFLDDTEEKYDTILNTNLKSVFFLIQKAVPHLEKTKGNIVNISSIYSSMTPNLSIIFAISKAGLDHLTRCLAVDLGSKGIRVNSVNPGYIPATRMLSHFGDEVERIEEEFVTSHRAQQPLKGRTGVVQDIAETVGFLVSDSAGFITGELIKVDGARSYGGSK